MEGGTSPAVSQGLDYFLLFGVVEIENGYLGTRKDFVVSYWRCASYLELPETYVAPWPCHG